MRGLASLGWSVSLFSLDPENRVGQTERSELGRLCDRSLIEKIHVPDSQRRARYVRDILLQRPVHRGLWCQRDVLSRFADHLETVTYDLVFLSQLFMAPYIPSAYWDRTIFDSQNAEAPRLIAMGRASRGTFRSVVARLQQRPVRDYESRVVNASALTLAVSDADAEYFGSLSGSPATVIRNGVSVDNYEPRDRPVANKNILLLGSLNYSANIDAAYYFLRTILPEITLPDARVSVVGLDPPSSLLRVADSIPRTTVIGYVESVSPFLERSRVLVVPLRYGGGTRLKILEAMAAGLPVVSTSAGCAGLGLRHDEQILIADEPSEFAHQVERVLTDDELSRRLSRDGRRSVETRFDWLSIATKLDRDLRHVVEKNASR